MSLSKETIGGEIVDGDGDHEPFDSRAIVVLAQGRPTSVLVDRLVTLENVVGQDALPGHIRLR